MVRYSFILLSLYFFDDVSFLTRLDIHNMGRVDVNHCLLGSPCELAWGAMAHASGGSGGDCCRSPGQGLEGELKLE